MLIAKRLVMVQATSYHPWFVRVMPKAVKIPAKETQVDLWLCQRAQVMIQVHTHYHLEVQANPKKIVQKKPMLFLASMGKTGLSHDVFFKFSVWPFEVIEFE